MVTSVLMIFSIKAFESNARKTRVTAARSHLKVQVIFVDSILHPSQILSTPTRGPEKLQGIYTFQYIFSGSP